MPSIRWCEKCRKNQHVLKYSQACTVCKTQKTSPIRKNRSVPQDTGPKYSYIEGRRYNADDWDITTPNKRKK